MTIQRWLQAPPNLSVEDSIDYMAERIHNIEKQLETTNAFQLLDTLSLSRSGTIAENFLLSAESQSPSGSLLLMNVDCESGEADLSVNVTGSFLNDSFDKFFVPGTTKNLVIPIKSPGIVDLSISVSGTVSVAPFNFSIERLLIKL